MLSQAVAFRRVLLCNLWIENNTFQGQFRKEAQTHIGGQSYLLDIVLQRLQEVL